jgi:small subunit ribosomal protein S17
MAQERENNKKILNGVVSGNSMEKTVKVLVESKESHPVYRKVIKVRKTYFARTEQDLNVGDKVTIMESRPYSKKVRWVVVGNDTKRK